jgi:fatty acid desaturase
MLFRDWQAAVANSLALLWTSAAWLVSFALMGASHVLLNLAGVVLCTHAMVLAAYLIHEAAHQTLFARVVANQCAGEAMSFIAGSSYASFERIRHMHIRHHVDRADVACFNFKALIQRRPAVRKALEVLEWVYLPATEILMHLQVIWRPFGVRFQRRHLPRAAVMLTARILLLVLLGLWSLKALVLYAVAALLLLHILNFFDAFHHSFEQYFIQPDEPVPMNGRDRGYELAHTYSNLIASRHQWLNLLTLNFGYHNAHHQRPQVPWFRLPRLHRELYGERDLCVMPLRELLFTWHRNRVRRVVDSAYGAPGSSGPGRADSFIGAHAVSFLTVV